MSNSPLQHPAVSNEIPEDEFIDLSKIYASVKRQWVVFFACIFSVTIIAGVLPQFLPKQWAASTTLQIGRMPSNLLESNKQISPDLIETTSQVVERLKLRDLQGRMMSEASFSVAEQVGSRAALFKKSLKATVVKGSDFIDIRVAGYSPEEARKNLNAVVKVLLAIHGGQFQSVETRLKQKLIDKKHQISLLQAERTQWGALLLDAKKPATGAPFLQNVVTLNVLNSKEVELRKLLAEQAVLEELLVPSQSYPTRVIDAVAADSSFYFPRLSLFLIGGLLLGVLLGLIVALFRDRHHGKTV